MAYRATAKYLSHSPVIRHSSLVEGHSATTDRHTTMSGYNGFEWVYNTFTPLKALKTVSDHKICCKSVQQNWCKMFEQQLIITNTGLFKINTEWAYLGLFLWTKLVILWSNTVTVCTEANLFWKQAAQSRFSQEV